MIIANPLQVKAIAHAHVKTDKIDAGTLTSRRAAGYLPEIWTPDAETERRRRLTARRYQVVRHRTRLKNEVHAILYAHLIPPCPHADLFSGVGRTWLERQPVPHDERVAIERHVRQLDRLAEDLAGLDKEIAALSLEDASIARLMTITGINLTVVASLMAAIGDVHRFPTPQKLVSYFWLNPRVRQSGLGAAHHGRISKAERSHARAMLVEAAGGGQDTRSAARLLRPYPGEAGSSDRRGGAGAKADGALLALADQGDRLPLGAARARGRQTKDDGTAGRPACKEGEQARPGLRLQRQGLARLGDAGRPASRGVLRAPGRAVAAAAAAREGCAGASDRQDLKAAWRGLQPNPALRHEVARA